MSEMEGMHKTIYAFCTPVLLYAYQNPETGQVVERTPKVGKFRIVWKASSEEDVRAIIAEMDAFAEELRDSSVRLSDFASAFYAATEEAQHRVLMGELAMDEDATLEYLRENRRGAQD